MINIFEVNETNKMIEQENLDVRTITMGISLLDCIDSDLDTMNQKIYDKNDTIGKSGIEQTMDSYLKGEKGEVKLYVNNVGKVIETVQGKKSKAGNDLYLTIDADLQVAAYHILEQELAGMGIPFERQELGNEVVTDGWNILARIPGRSGKKPFLFVFHLVTAAASNLV